MAAFPEQFKVSRCPLTLSDELFDGIKSACGGAKSGADMELHHTRFRGIFQEHYAKIVIVCRAVERPYGATLLSSSSFLHGDYRSCLGEIEESLVKTKPDTSICNVNGDDDDQRIINLDDDNFDNFTLSQIKASCKTRKRKQSQGLDSSKINMKVEDSSFLEDYRKKHRATNDYDFLETFDSLKSKLSKNMKAKKKKFFEEPSPTDTQEIMLVIKFEPQEILNNQELPPSSKEILDYHEFSASSQEIQDYQEFSPSCEEIQDGQEFPPISEEIKIDQEIPFFSGDSISLVEVKSEVPKADCYGENNL
ncbi:hypothetical protein JHK87_016415 [Glycine soja]|nr:hypothetical protein JHK87_016415 [Glycine soja]